MNFDNVMKASLTIYDELVTDNDKASVDIINQIDSGETDAEIKAGIIAGVNRLEALGKTQVANEVKELTKGFAY